MNRRGVCYDVGRVMWDRTGDRTSGRRRYGASCRSSRPTCTADAVRICGQDIDRLVGAAQDALDLNLEVWLSPELWDRSPSETLTYIAEAAGAAATLRSARTDAVVLSVGSESTLFMAGIVEGNTVFERLGHPAFWEHVRRGAHNGPLNAFLAQAAERARRVFPGPITYASVPLEAVDWRPFDIVSVDLYRDARVKDRFADLVRPYLAQGRPVAITEFGCCTYAGAADAGGHGFDILDISAGDSTPSRLKGAYLRDETEQETELTELLRIFDQLGVDATFVMTFVAPLNPTSADPVFDLDMASYALVKSFGGRLGPLGEAHPEAPWQRDRYGNDLPRHALGAKGVVSSGRGLLRWQGLMPGVRLALEGQHTRRLEASCQWCRTRGSAATFASGSDVVEDDHHVDVGDRSSRSRDERTDLIRGSING